MLLIQLLPVELCCPLFGQKLAPGARVTAPILLLDAALLGQSLHFFRGISRVPLASMHVKYDVQFESAVDRRPSRQERAGGPAEGGGIPTQQASRGHLPS